MVPILSLARPSVFAEVLLKPTIESRRLINAINLGGFGTFALGLTLLVGCGSGDAPAEESAGVNRAALASGLVAAYSFDEGAGTSAADASGNPNVGTLLNGASWGVGHSSNAASFDGVNDFVSGGNIAALSGLTAVTASAWIKGGVAPGSGDAVIVAKDAAFALVVAGHKLLFGVKSSGTWYGFGVRSTSSVDDGNYHFVTGVYDGANVRVYVDGAQQATLAVGARTLTASTVALQIASCVGGPNCEASGEMWQGQIDDVRVYSRALTSAEIVADRDTPVAPADAVAPSAPGNVSANAVSVSRIDLTWTASTDDVAVTQYQIFRGATQVGTATGTSFSDIGLAPSTSYSYTIKAKDAAQNQSAASTAVSASTLPDTTAPSKPSGLAASVTSPSQVKLVWTASTDDVGVAQYRVFRDNTQIGTSTTPAFVDSSLSAGTTYAYSVVAADSAQNVSSTSASVSVTTPAAADTTPPSAPTALAGNAISPTQIALSWTASTDNVGVVEYSVFRGGTLVGISATTTFTSGSLSPSTTYSFSVKARDAAQNLSVASTAVSVTTPAASDVTPPSAPSNLTGFASSSTQVSLSWTASTDNVGVVEYLVFRSGTLIGTSSSPAYSDAGLSPSTSYSYTVKARDAAQNLSAASGAKTITTQAPSGQSVFASDNFDRPNGAPGANWTVIDSDPRVVNNHVEESYASDGNDSIAIYTGLAWPTNQYSQVTVLSATAHSGCATFVRAKNDPVIEMYFVYVTGPLGPNARLTLAKFVTHVYTELWTAVMPVNSGDQLYLSVSGTELTVKLNGTSLAVRNDSSISAAGYPGFDITDYDGRGRPGDGQCDAWEAGSFESSPPIAPPTPTGVTASAQSSSQINVGWTASTGATGYHVFRNGAEIGTSLSASYLDSGLSLGTSYTYNVSAYDTNGNSSALSTSVTGSTLGDTTPPTAPTNLAGSVASSTQISLSWTASTDNVAVVRYRVLRNGTAVGTPTGTSFADVGLSPATSYAYSVLALDQAGNVSAASSSITATTGSSPPTAPPTPTGVTASAQSSSQINVGWAASTGATGYHVFRNGAEIGTSLSTSYFDSGLSLGTSYTYNVSAYDTNGNSSALSSSTTATTLGDTTAPTAPTNLAGSAASSTQIGLSWTASTDNVGVVRYRVLRNGTAVGTPTATSFTDVGLSPATSYSYSVVALDPAGNVSAASSSITVATSSAPAPSGPIVAFGFNDGAGLVCIDSSGNGFTGSLINGPLWASGHTGSALGFDGVNDWVGAGNIAALNGLTRTTVSAWVKGSVGSSSPDGILVAKDAAFALVVENHKLLFGVKSGGQWLGFPASSTGVDDGAYHFVTGVYDGSQIRVYVDGVLEASAFIGSVTLNTTTTELQIASCLGGPNCDHSGEMWAGSIDDVRVYDRALSAAEIVADMNAPLN
jgi:chitodextrinase